jgi:hypothetical protein
VQTGVEGRRAPPHHARRRATLFFRDQTKAGDGAIQGGARHGTVGMLLVPPGDVGVERGVGRRFEAGAQHVQVVLIATRRSARRTARREGRSRARLAKPAFDAGQTDGEGRGRRTAGHPLLDGGDDSFTKIKRICSHTDSLP